MNCTSVWKESRASTIEVSRFAVYEYPVGTNSSRGIFRWKKIPFDHHSEAANGLFGECCLASTVPRWYKLAYFLQRSCFIEPRGLFTSIFSRTVHQKLLFAFIYHSAGARVTAKYFWKPAGQTVTWISSDEHLRFQGFGVHVGRTPVTGSFRPSRFSFLVHVFIDICTWMWRKLIDRNYDTQSKAFCCCCCCFFFCWKPNDTNKTE